MNGFEKRKQMKMESIRKSAQALFMKNGVQKVNIQEIARQAKVSQVTIYNYFGSKEKLLVEVIRHMLAEMNDEFYALLESEKPFQEKVETFIQLKVDFTREMNEDFLTALLSENAEIRDLYEQYSNEQALPFFKAFIDQGKAEGAIRNDLSFESILFYVNAFSNEVYKHPDFVTNPLTRNKISTDLNRLFFYGLSGKK